MFKKIVSLKFLINFFTFFNLFVCFFPLVRIYLFGGKEMNGFVETAFTILPDIFILFNLIIAALIVYVKKNKGFNWHIFDFFVLSFFLINVVYGFAISDMNKQAFMSFRITYYPILFYFVARLFEQEKPEIYIKAINRNFIGFLSLAIAGLILYFGFIEFQKKMILETGNLVPEYFIIRMTSFLLTPILFATLMSFSCVYFYDKLMKNFSWKYLLIFLIFWLCLLLTVSRGAIIAFTMTFLFLTVIYREIKISAIVLSCMALVLISVSFYATNNFDSIKWMCYSTVDTVSLENNVTRVDRWSVTLNDFFKQKSGYGFGKTGAVAYRYYINEPSVKAAVYSTDGWFLKTACETGIMGLVSYLVLAISYFFIIIKSAFKYKNTLLLVPLGIFIVVNIQSLVSNTLDFYPQTLFYWFLIGISINSLNQKREL